MKLTLYVGPPGYGKSTLMAKRGVLDESVFNYSTDGYVEDVAKARGVTYDDVFSEVIDEAHRVMNDKLQAAYDIGLDVVWDQTNLTVKKRRGILRNAKARGYEVHCVAFVASDEMQRAEVNFRRGNRPGKTIPPHVVESMESNYVVPSITEGFDSVEIVDIYGETRMRTGLFAVSKG